MSGGGLPAWATVAIAALTGTLGLAGAVIAARIGARIRERELAQQRELDRAGDRMKAIDEAIATALEYREPAAVSLRMIQGEESSWTSATGLDPLWSLDHRDVTKFRRHEAALITRFGVEHEVTRAWRTFAWALGEAVAVARDHRDAAMSSGGEMPPEVRDLARDRRRAARRELEAFVAVASTAVASAAHPPRDPFARPRRTSSAPQLLRRSNPRDPADPARRRTGKRWVGAPPCLSRANASSDLRLWFDAST
jgi:hypothetical protein